ncbi:MAG: SpoIID/LytB domain-containing protein [Candidatus Babeliaceae bacterium]
MNYRLFIFCLFIFFPLKSFQVRVLLQKNTCAEINGWQLHNKNGFKVAMLADETCNEDCLSETLVLEVRSNMLCINGRKVHADALRISALDDAPIAYNGNSYSGFFIIIKKDGEVYFINSIDLEEYVCSVVRWESWPGWPLEVNKVFAIACRSYVVAKIMEAREKKRVFDIKCTNLHQTYKGVHNFDVLRQAVDETCGIIMTYQKKPINAMYDCCCGGIIPSKVKGFDFKAEPYLARTYPCTYCKECKLYSWKVSYTVSDFEKLLEAHFQKKTRVKDIKVSQKDGAEIVQEVTVKTPRSWLKLTGRKIYSLCKNIKSFCFSIKKKENHIIFEGKGYGHHLGLCQWGAWRMVKNGWNCRRILQFFYCDISFMQIEEYARTQKGEQ